MGQQRFEPGSARDIATDGHWFRDSVGRYVLFRGVNFGARSKLPPYLPIMPLSTRDLTPDSIDRFYAELSAVQPQLDLLQQLGFNVVRLLVMWKALEPRPNPQPERLLPEGERYLALLREIVDALYARGLFVILDFHQDIAHECFGGDGFPDWALATAADVGRCGSTPLGVSRHDRRWGLNYYELPWFERAVGLGKASRGVRRTLAAFWANRLRNGGGLVDFPVRSHLVETVGAVMRYFRGPTDDGGHPAILGIEPFNEPHPVGIPKREFEERILPGFYREVLAALQRPLPGRVDRDEEPFLFVEPRMDWITFAADGPEYGGVAFTRTPTTYLPAPLFALTDTATEGNTATDVMNGRAERAVLAFHYYDPWTFLWTGLPLVAWGDDMRTKERDWPAIFHRLRDAATARGLAPFLTEFGGNQDWERFHTDLRPAIYHGKQIRAYMDLQFRQVEALLLNATYWNFDLYNTAEAHDNWNHEDFSLLGPERTPRHLDIVARPYPLRSSARPSCLWFDLATRHCALAMKGPAVSAPTVIYLPARLHYREGFEVRASSDALAWNPEQQLLWWQPAAGHARHLSVICPPHAFDLDALPQSVRETAAMLPLSLVGPPL